MRNKSILVKRSLHIEKFYKTYFVKDLENDKAYYEKEIVLEGEHIERKCGRKVASSTLRWSLFNVSSDIVPILACIDLALFLLQLIHVCTKMHARVLKNQTKHRNTVCNSFGLRFPN